MDHSRTNVPSQRKGRATLKAIRGALQPRLASADDTTVAVLVWTIGMCGAGVLVVSAFYGAGVRDVGLKALGGILLLLSAYFTARNLLYSSRAGFLERFMRAAELLSDNDPVKKAAGKAVLHRLRDHARDEQDETAVTTVLRAEEKVSNFRTDRSTARGGANAVLAGQEDDRSQHGEGERR